MAETSLLPAGPAPRIVVASGPPPEHARRLEAVRALAWLLDRAIVIPGTRFRIGLDAILGLIPVAGDVIAMAIGSYILWTAARVGAPRPVLLRMLANIGADTALGSVPLVGDILDAAWRANAKNAALLEQVLTNPGQARRSSRWVLAGIVGLGLAMLVGSVVLAVWLVRLVTG